MTDDPYKAMPGTWTLIAPNGQRWQGHSPINVLSKEATERIPAQVRMERLTKSLADLETVADVRGCELWSTCELKLEGGCVVGCLNRK